MGATGKFISFRRKRDETPFEALERLDKKLARLQFELSNWITVPTVYGIRVTHKLEDNKKLLLAIRKELLAEIDARHETLMELNPNVVII